MFLILSLSAFGQDYPVLGFNDYELERAAARIETRCNIPVSGERGPIKPTVDLEGIAYQGCDIPQIVQAFQAVIEPPCSYAIVALETSQGAPYVHFGPGVVADSGACELTQTVLDQPIDLPTLGSYDATDLMGPLKAYGFRVMADPVRNVYYPGVSGRMTTRELLNSLMIELPDGRRTEWKMDPEPDGTFSLQITFAGGPYLPMYGGESGPYSIDTRWWQRDTDRFRPLTAAEKSEVWAISRRREAGEITTEEALELQRAIFHGTLIERFDHDGSERVRVMTEEYRRRAELAAEAANPVAE